MSGCIGGLQSKVQELYSKALFVHYFNHYLNLDPSQAVSNLKDCKLFFQTLTELRTFFSFKTN